MCLITEQFKPKTARKDITCYKVLTEDFRNATYFGKTFEYFLDVEYETTLLQSDAPCYFDTDADYYGNKFFGSLDTLVQKKILNAIGQGFHSFEYIPYDYVLANSKICKFIIPKGSLYYENAVGMYVSNKIKRISDKII